MAVPIPKWYVIGMRFYFIPSHLCDLQKKYLGRLEVQ